MIGYGDIQKLLQQADDHMLSLYLNVDPSLRENQAATPAWRISAKNALRDLSESIDRDNAIWPEIRGRVERFLEEYQPNGKSLALLYGPDFEQVYALPVRLENQAAFGKPLLMPLLWAIDEYKPYLIAMIDREEAHFYITYLGEVGFQDTVKLDLDTEDWRRKTAMPSPSGVSRGNQEDPFVSRLEEHVARFYREATARVQHLIERRQAQRIVVAGNEQSAHAVRHLLPEKLARAVVAVLPIPMRAAEHEILAHVLPAAQEHERREELELIEEIVSLAKSGRRGVIGHEAVLQALEQQRVELLVAPWPLEGELAVDLPLKTFASGGKMELVHGQAAQRLKAEGGLAARLYYAG